MVAKTLIAALARVRERQAQDSAAQEARGRDFPIRVSAIFGRRKELLRDIEGQSPSGLPADAEDSSIWEDGDAPERLPDVPTVPDGPGTAEGTARRKSGRSGGRGVAKRGNLGRKVRK